jgi:uncharacterized repeat protein (TIGR03803 family)
MSAGRIPRWAALGLVLANFVQASTLTSIYSFTGQNGDGATPCAGVVVGTNGVLYGTTAFGGTFGAGTVYELTPVEGGGWTETVLYSFTGGNDGAYPQAGLTLGAGGILYGATLYGGAAGMGAVFQLTPPGASGLWTETVIHSFSGTDGAYPYSAPVIAQNGMLYGTTELGGLGSGTVFRLTPPTSGNTWSEAVLYSFTGAADGAFPYAGLALDSKGNLYGTTAYGGSQSGVVFELARPAKSGGAWTETVLHAFKGTDGGYPFAGVVFGANGSLYGTTPGGVGAAFGSAFELAPPASGKTWKQTILAKFYSDANGGSPHASLIFAPGGAILGTDLGGGSGSGFTGNGLVFQLNPPVSGTAWTENVLYTFLGGADGGGPDAPLVAGANGVFYGTTLRGGTSGYGTVYAVTQ